MRACEQGYDSDSETAVDNSFGPVQVHCTLVQRSMPVLLAGDQAGDDRLVRDVALRESRSAVAVVSAQASMDHALSTILESEHAAPIFSSPRLALAQASSVLNLCA